jgi:hypothetical protein
MKTLTVISSNIKKFEYDEENKDFYAHFANGTTYKYPKVNKELWDLLVKLDTKTSYGKWFSRYIRKHYKGTKI